MSGLGCRIGPGDESAARGSSSSTSTLNVPGPVPTPALSTAAPLVVSVDSGAAEAASLEEAGKLESEDNISVEAGPMSYDTCRKESIDT